MSVKYEDRHIGDIACRRTRNDIIREIEENREADCKLIDDWVAGDGQIKGGVSLTLTRAQLVWVVVFTILSATALVIEPITTIIVLIIKIVEGIVLYRLRDPLGVAGHWPPRIWFLVNASIGVILLAVCLGRGVGGFYTEHYWSSFAFLLLIPTIFSIASLHLSDFAYSRCRF